MGTRLSRSSASSTFSHEQDAVNDLDHQKFLPGDLVIISAWECEGIQQPFCFTFPQPKNEGTVRAARRMPLAVGTFGIIINKSEPDEISHVVLIDGQQLTVMNRFLRGALKGF